MIWYHTVLSNSSHFETYSVIYAFIHGKIFENYKDLFTHISGLMIWL